MTQTTSGEAVLPPMPSQAPQYAPSGEAAPPPAPTEPLPPLPSQSPIDEPSGEQAPPQAGWVYSYPTGSWVYSSDEGWVWVPVGATTSEVDGVPYVFLYTAAFGWTWYLSPWGWGPYHYGAWVVHPWRPAGWRGGRVAHPRVVEHLGHGGAPGGAHRPVGGRH